MALKERLSQAGVINQCRKYGLPLWQCPQIVFAVMGGFIAFSAIIAYSISSKYVEDPLLIAFFVILLTWVLLILSYIVTRSFERLAEASRMKIEFLTIMTHQIRAPFSNMRWVTDLLMSEKKGPLGERENEYFKILRENSKRLEELINKIITVSRIEQGELPSKKELTSLKKLVDKVIFEFKPFAEASNVTVEFKSQGNLPKVSVDDSQIREVIENFIDNAIKYTGEKGKVEVLLSNKGKNVCLEVKDSGVGVPKEDQKYVFRKFFRSEVAMKKQTQGSGLGLFIAKSIIESHRGKIGFTSQEGKGSTFWFTLPAAKNNKV
jgi:signal transduction histidine kinase